MSFQQYLKVLHWIGSHLYMKNQMQKKENRPGKVREI